MRELTVYSDFKAFRRRAEADFLDKAAYLATFIMGLRVSRYDIHDDDRNGAMFTMDALTPDGKECEIAGRFSPGCSDDGNIMISWRLNEPDSPTQNVELLEAGDLAPSDVAKKILDIIGR